MAKFKIRTKLVPLPQGGSQGMPVLLMQDGDNWTPVLGMDTDGLDGIANWLDTLLGEDTRHEIFKEFELYEKQKGIFMHQKNLVQKVVYSHVWPDGKVMHLNVTDLLASPVYQIAQKVMVNVDPELASWMVDNKGIELHRVNKLLTAKILDPILVLETADGTHIFADGNHRYVVAALRKMIEIRAIMMKPHEWEPFVVTGVPEMLDNGMLKNMYSGL